MSRLSTIVFSGLRLPRPHLGHNRLHFLIGFLEQIALTHQSIFDPMFKLEPLCPLSRPLRCMNRLDQKMVRVSLILNTSE